MSEWDDERLEAFIRERLPYFKRKYGPSGLSEIIPFAEAIAERWTRLRLRDEAAGKLAKAVVEEADAMGWDPRDKDVPEFVELARAWQKAGAP
jgi:hypothetical protein